uniref:Uncharacterized protein n=1 Tax=Arundo donax TaxID=35708 RepID=A0A0A9AID6_ARUDO
MTCAINFFNGWSCYSLGKQRACCLTEPQSGLDWRQSQ